MHAVLACLRKYFPCEHEYWHRGTLRSIELVLIILLPFERKNIKLKTGIANRMFVIAFIVHCAVCNHKSGKIAVRYRYKIPCRLSPGAIYYVAQ
jgi:hypothetical protein